MEMCWVDDYNDYRYSFQGQERDDEVKGGGNSYNYKYRMHDPRLGRWLAVDPRVGEYPAMSSYSFVGNMVMMAVDPDGETIFISGKVGGKKKKIEFKPGEDPPKRSSRFVKDAWAAMEREINRGTGDHICALVQDNEISVKIKQTKGATRYSAKSAKKGVVKFNSRVGLVGTYYEDPDDFSSKQSIYPDDRRTIFSPADILNHELGHADNDLVDGTGDEDVARDPSWKTMGDCEEEQVILEHDNQAGKIRQNHGGYSVKVRDVFDDSPGRYFDKEKILPDTKTDGRKARKKESYSGVIYKDNLINKIAV